MGIFKTIGTKIKRVVSLKNAINGITGNFSAVAQDVARVATTQAPPKKGAPVTASKEQIMPSFAIPAPINGFLQVQGAKQSDKLKTAISSSKLVQDNITDVNDFVFSVWLKSTWLKHKKIIIISLVALSALLAWKFMGKKTPTRSRVRR